MKKWFVAMMAALACLIVGCNVEDTAILCGREWNVNLDVIADTASEFEMNDPLIVQFRYGTNFDFAMLKTTFYEGTLANKGPEIWNHEVAVNEKQGVYTLQGKSRHGGLMTARELCRKKEPGPVVIEVRGDGKVLMTKQILLIKNR